MANGGIIGPINDPTRGPVPQHIHHQEITHHQVMDQAQQLY
jgi:hypothetical protein